MQTPRTYLAWAILVLGFLAASVDAQVTRRLDSLDGVGVDERLGKALPLHLEFKDSAGRIVRLGDYFQGSRPVLLTLNYSSCPMLCILQLNGLVDGLRDLEFDAGTEFDVISVSIDPSETPQQARLAKQRYVKAYGRQGTASGWHFLTGNEKAIRELADSVGFRFKYVPERKEYAHAAAVMVCTPEGTTSRYLYGVLFPARTLRLSLVEAGEGKVGSTLDRVLLFCFHYDAASGRYAPVARQLMKAGAGVTLTVIILGLVPAWLRRRNLGVKESVNVQNS